MSDNEYYTKVHCTLRDIRSESQASIDQIHSLLIPVVRHVVEIMSKQQQRVDGTNLLQKELDFLHQQFHFHEALIVDTDTTFEVDDIQFQSQTMKRRAALRDSRKETVVLLQNNLKSVETELVNVKQLIKCLKWLYCT
jgi:hypothetical protein